MGQLEKFIKHISTHSDTKKISFDGAIYTYKEIVFKSYALARYIENTGYKKVFFNLKNSPLSICLYLAGWIADIDLLVPINHRLISNELEQIIEPNSLFITDNIQNITKNHLQNNNVEKK